MRAIRNKHQGYLIFALHAHLPYVRHPEHERFLEECWLYEAMAETYIPLIDMLIRLKEEGIRYRLTLSLSPTLIAMLQDSFLKERFIRHMERLIELSDREVRRTRKSARLNRLARMYNIKFKNTLDLYVGKYRTDLIKPLKALARTGSIELITTSATHAYLPNLAQFEDMVEAQISIGIDEYKSRFGREPRGFWLPECGYYTGLDQLLRKNGINYTFLETHGLLFGSPRPRHGTYKPARTPAGLAMFARDAESSRLVWCSKTGYPAHPVYRDFYTDIGFYLPQKYLKPFAHPDGIRMPTTIKYHCISDRKKKTIYDRERALRQAALHAQDFLLKKQAQVQKLKDIRPTITAIYDAELFGHWWHEGINWLEYFLKALASQDIVFAVTPSEYLATHRRLPEVEPSPSSWGRGGYSATWCSDRNDWAIRHIHMGCIRMRKLAAILRQSAEQDLLRRAFNQALRELLLMQASDWQFLIDYGTAPHYAELRLRKHICRFNLLYEMITTGQIDEGFVTQAELMTNLFAKDIIGSNKSLGHHIPLKKTKIQ